LQEPAEDTALSPALRGPSDYFFVVPFAAFFLLYNSGGTFGRTVTVPSFLSTSIRKSCFPDCLLLLKL